MGFDYDRQKKAYAAVPVVNSLLWLNQLCDRDQAEVGMLLVQLSQALRQGDLVQPGIIVPNTLMETVWSAVAGLDKILDRFPHQRLNVSLAQPVQVQHMAQTLQSGILAQSLPADWRNTWQSQLQQWDAQALWLTPYVWTEHDRPESIAAKQMLLAARGCQPQVEALEQGLKGLWAELFQAQRLHILQDLEFRPDHLRMSILVQPLPPVSVMGWLRLGELQFQLQAQPGYPLRLDVLGADLPNCYQYNLQTQQFQSVVEGQPGMLSESTLQRLMKLGRQWQARWPTDTVLSWILTGDGADAPIQLLGPLLELPFPMAMQGWRAPLSRTSSVTLPVNTSSFPVEQFLLGTGCGVAPGYVSAPVTLLDETSRLTPVPGSILVAHQIEPSYLPWLATAAGLICETGGFASHGAIMARELGLPAVVGLSGIMSQMQPGQWITLDGDHGRVYTAEPPTPETLSPVQPLEPPVAEPPLSPQHPRQLQVLVSVSSLQRLASFELESVDGIGIVRSEWLLLTPLATTEQTIETVTDPNTLFQRQGKQLAAIAQSVYPRPVFYRSADLDHWHWNQLGIGAQDTLSLDTVLGVRGTLRYLDTVTLLEQELLMLKTLRRQGMNNLHLVLPFVRSPQEVAFCRAKMRAAGLESSTELPLWMMAEVPSVLFGLSQYHGLGLEGIMIGTHDLAQLLLGIDRNHPMFQTVLTQNGSVLESALRQLVHQASNLDLASILCSSMPQHHTATFIAPLIQAGLRGVSVEMGAVATVLTAITQAEQALGIVDSLSSLPSPKPV
jgi:pyruvate,water dikinase